MTNLITTIPKWWEDNQDREEYTRTGEVVKTYQETPGFVDEALRLEKTAFVITAEQFTAAIKQAFDAGWSCANSRDLWYTTEEQKAVDAALITVKEK